MSYCRMHEDSDVYAFNNVICVRGRRDKIECNSAKEMLTELLKLHVQGYKIPNYAIRRLQKEHNSGLW